MTPCMRYCSPWVRYDQPRNRLRSDVDLCAGWRAARHWLQAAWHLLRHWRSSGNDRCGVAASRTYIGSITILAAEAFDHTDDGARARFRNAKKCVGLKADPDEED